MRRRITHGDCPRELFETTSTTTVGSKHPRQDETPPDDSTVTKKPRQTRTLLKRGDIDHPKMKAAMKALRAIKPRPTVGKLCSAAGCFGNQLFPDYKGICIRAQLWGECDSNCKHEHILLPDSIIDGTISKLRKVIDNPKLLQV